MNITFAQKHGYLLSYYRRPADVPILLRFSSADFDSSSTDSIPSVIEETFGPALAIWSEEIGSDGEVADIMLALSKKGAARRSKDASHFIYVFFADWYASSNNVKLIFDLVFIGGIEHWFCGGVGENVILVRRVFENSPEYTCRMLNKLLH
jgi:hypothetical protein